MKIAINALPYTSWQGIETYLAHLIKHWPLKNDDKLVIFANQKSADFFHTNNQAIEIRVIPFFSLSKLILFAYQQIILPFKLRKEKFDLLFCASLISPWLYKKNIITIHDAAPFAYKKENGLLGKIFWRLNLFFARRALSIITVSEFSKKELMDRLKIPADKIKIIGNALPEYIKEENKKEDANKEEITEDKKEKEKIELPSQPYLISVGNARPRKNLEILPLAQKILKERGFNFKICLVGKMDKYMNEFKQKNIDNSDIIFTSFVSEADKNHLISQAFALIFPSRYEGFGLPILEANNLNCPLICSDIPAFREIAQNSALYFNPDSASELAERIIELLKNHDKKIKLLETGKENIKRFSWKEEAIKLAKHFHNYENPTNK